MRIPDEWNWYPFHLVVMVMGLVKTKAGYQESRVGILHACSECSNGHKKTSEDTRCLNWYPLFQVMMVMGLAKTQTGYQASRVGILHACRDDE